MNQISRQCPPEYAGRAGYVLYSPVGKVRGALPGDLEALREAESHEAEQRYEVQHQQDDQGDGGPAIGAFRTLQRSFLLDRRS
mgnify:CR=1 FL=1